ncbi:MAG TPA: 1,2-phenylacetyl-CoA epoxidase subunit PaaE [Jatrophihabitantaceae bacterium]|jgi:ring-1,2-phenylacetyl-CoA epoxidase subunit PaaE
MATFAKLRVAAVDELCDDAVAITFDVPPGFEFRPGQSLTIRRGEARRSYSICAPAGAKPRIGVREVAGGAVSSWLVHEVKPGDEVEALPPSGRFVPDLGTPGQHVLIAAGSGITPVLSIAASVLRHPASRVTLLYGNRRTDSVMFADELADLKDRYPDRVTLIHVLSREARDVELFSGRLDAAKLRELVPLVVEAKAVDHWWLCGPYGMVVDARQVLTELGVAAGQIHRELFYVEDVAPPPATHADATPDGPASQVTVILDGRATTVALPRTSTVLEGAQRARPDLPFACKGGVCGTCRGKVVSGEVHMRRNFALDDNETDDGFVLTCQSTPVTDEVTVDYDA